MSPINDKTCDDGSKKCNFYGVANGGWDYDHGVCSSRIEKRVSINWFETDTDRRDGFQDDDLLTALVCNISCFDQGNSNMVTLPFILQTVVHETGHNLGMRHDFDDYDHSQRYDSSGRPCKGHAYFMVNSS